MDEEAEEEESMRRRRAKSSTGARASSVSAISTRRRLAVQHTALSECVQVLKYASKCLSEPCEEVSGEREFNSGTARDLCRRLLEYATHNTDPMACEMLAEVRACVWNLLYPADSCFVAVRLLDRAG